MSQTDKPGSNEALITYLRQQTGVTETQARDLIKVLGTDRPSLLREAREIAKQRLR